MYIPSPYLLTLDNSRGWPSALNLTRIALKGVDLGSSLRVNLGIYLF